MSRFEKLIFGTLVVIALILWTNLGWSILKENWQTPLGPEMGLPKQTAKPDNGTNQQIPPSIPQDFLFEQIPTTAHSANTAKLPKCNGPESMTVLAIGSDTRAQTYLYGLADVIRYVRVDFITPSISVLEFPRDLWVAIPEIEEHYGITHGKLNQAYFYGNPGMGYYQGTGQGPGLLARTLDLNFSAHPDHYIAANMHTFVRLVDAVGGIDITLPFSVDARKPDQEKREDLYFAPGEHHLTGEQALMLGRIREYSVFARADQQNRIMCALRNTFISPSILPKIPAIIDSFSNAIQTDLSPQQLSQLACLVSQIKPGNISFTTFPRELLTEARTYDIGVKKDVYIFKADFETLKYFVKAFDMGAWPEHNSAPLTPSIPRPRGEGLYNCP
ncbi:MAG: LCP family protein [Chloroflexi bacterium]|nr:LCP family protein [Chloroflexota bacterium]